MSVERSIRRYRRWYARLLRLYSKPYHERFGESMEQTFADLLRERAEEKRSVLGCALWMFAETFSALLGEVWVRYRSILRIALATALILLLPWLAMQITDEVAWDLVDFAVAGVLLFGAGLAYELVGKKGGTIAYRVATGLAVATALLVVWMNLAVGLIGNEEDPANLMYGAVLGVGLFGVVLARFRPHGMARALFATALAQVLVGVILLIAGLGLTLILNGFLTWLWVGSALLFRRAAQTQVA